MILSQGAEYALRIATFLALQSPSRRFNSTTLSKASNIPLHYSSKILKKLVNAGILNSVRGKSGGFLLNKPPKQIKFSTILQAVDEYPSENHCVFGLSHCGSASPCLLHYRWMSFKEMYFEWADRNTVADVINDVSLHKSLARFRSKRSGTKKVR